MLPGPSTAFAVIGMSASPGNRAPPAILLGGKFVRQVAAMPKHLSLFAALALFGLLAAARAQNAPPTSATTRFDGTYALVAAAKLTETSNAGGRLIHCPDWPAHKPLIIAGGEVKYAVQGVGRPQGDLAMRFVIGPFPTGREPPILDRTSSAISTASASCMPAEWAFGATTGSSGERARQPGAEDASGGSRGAAS
jgi:hypothetical protein